MAFQTGATVVEKTKGTPRMKVIGVSGSDITCQWFGPDNGARTRVIPASDLVAVPTRG